MFANKRIAQNDKLQKDMDIQSKEIKDLCVANGCLKEKLSSLLEKLSSLLQDTNLQIKTVRKLVRDWKLDRVSFYPASER